MKTFLGIGWFILGIVQFAAIVNGFIDSLGGFIGIIAAFVLGEIPILGTIMGIRGATHNWNWDLFPAILLFCGAPVIGFIIGVIANRQGE
jgi:hypothetical protein